MTTTSPSANVPKVGYVPVSFPRDPKEVNQFLEHMILGQILEPLIEADGTGAIADGIAESWSFSKDGKTIHFILRKDQRFSNGQPLTAHDVAYTLQRNLHQSSQSSGFLEAIQHVEAKGDHALDIRLKYADTAIIKALSRDQLGIVPDKWAFDPKSDEPIIGTGHYRLIRKAGEWYLEANKFNGNFPKIKEKTWKLVFFSNDKFELPPGELPDVAPLLTKVIFERMQKHPLYSESQYSVSPAISFFQTSFWIHPSGKTYGDPGRRQLLCHVFRKYVQLKLAQTGLKPAHGMIPLGIAGHLPQPLGDDAIGHEIKPSKTKAKFQVAVVAGMFDDLDKLPEMKALLSNMNVELELVPYVPAKIKEFFSSHSPDAFTGSWAGGYNDPTGFIGLLYQMIRQDFAAYIGKELAPTYLQAKEELDWTKRAELFRKLDEGIQRGVLLVPGWSLPQYQVIRNGIRVVSQVFRYTPRLINFSR